MGVYTNIKCGNCNFSITEGYKRKGTLDNFSSLGPEFLICPKCNSKNLTGKIPFSKMNNFAKIGVIFLMVINSLIFGFLYGSLIYLLFYWIICKIGLKTNFNDFNKMSIVLLIIFDLFFSTFLFYFQRKSIKEYEI